MTDIVCLEICVVDFQATVYYILKSTRETYTVPTAERCLTRLPFTLFTYPQSGISLDGRQWPISLALKIAL